MTQETTDESDEHIVVIIFVPRRAGSCYLVGAWLVSLTRPPIIIAPPVDAGSIIFDDERHTNMCLGRPSRW